MSDDETLFEWSDPELIETLANVLLIDDAEAANVVMHRPNGDITFVVLRLRTKTKEGASGELAIAFTKYQSATVSDVLRRLSALGDSTERRN